MPGIATISMDNYNDASRVIDNNFDDPRLTDYDTLLENINDLRQGKPVNVPIYDFKQSRRVGHRRVGVPSSRVVIIEGIYALSDRIRPLLDLRVSITGGVHFDLVKRVLRDINRSGQAPEDIIHQISETVYPMYKAFIEPDLQTAHLKIINKFNPFSGFQNATYILKSPREVTEECIRAALSGSVSTHAEETYDIYLLPPGEDPETCQSYLRMRNREGKYSLMFEEWVTDGPFIISPRITFEVSVRLLGGLMALGYEMSTILKRTSQVYIDSDSHVTVKLDKLEQLQRSYVQVQGKDRQLVMELAKKLGLEGAFMPRSYIEQIQLEKLTKEVQATAKTLPSELKERFSIGDEVVSPRLTATWVNPFGRSHSSRQWTVKDVSSSAPVQQQHDRRKDIKVKRVTAEAPPGPTPESPLSYNEQQREANVRISEQLAGVMERLDELLSRVSELEVKVTSPPPKEPPPAITVGPGRPPNGLTPNGGLLSTTAQNGNGGGFSFAVGSWGSQGGYGVGSGSLPTSISVPGGAGEPHLADEVRTLARGQRHITAQIDVLTAILRDSQQQKAAELRGRGPWEALFGSMRTGHAGLATAGALLLAGLATTVAVAVIRVRRT
eukprot:SM000083S22738  [mRNA]  locus=s83:264280:268574:+ [translate_table: standard]